MAKKHESSHHFLRFVPVSWNFRRLNFRTSAFRFINDNLWNVEAFLGGVFFFYLFVCLAQTTPECSVSPRESRRLSSPKQELNVSMIETLEMLHWRTWEVESSNCRIGTNSRHTRTHTRTHRARIIGVCLCLRLMLSAFSPHQCLRNGRPLVLCEDRRTSPAFICSTPTTSYFQRTAIHATVGFTKLLTSALRHHGCYSRPVLDVILVLILHAKFSQNFLQWAWLKNTMVPRN